MSFFQTILSWVGLAPRSLSPEAFTARYAKLVRKSFPAAEIEVVEPLHLRIAMGDGKSLQSFLDNAYDLYRSEPAHADAVIMSRVNALAELIKMEERPIDKERIVGVLKDTAWLKEVLAAGGADAPKDPGKEQVIDPLNDLLVIAYAEDTPTSMRYLTADALEKTGIPRESLRALAAENLLDLLPPPEMHQGKGYYLVTAGGDYEASLLGVQRFWTKDRFPLEGDLIAAVPTRDVLLVTATNEPEGLARVRELVPEIYNQGSYRLSQQLFVVKDGQVLPWE